MTRSLSTLTACWGVSQDLDIKECTRQVESELREIETASVEDCELSRPLHTVLHPSHCHGTPLKHYH